MKKCTKCKQEKPLTLEFFSHHKHTKNGFNSWCKECHSNVFRSKYNQKHNPINHKRYGKGVYGIFSNGMCLYVGQSSRLYDRINKHKWLIKNPHKKDPLSHLYQLLQQYNSLIIGIIEQTDNHKNQEKYWIDKFQPLHNVK